MTTIDPNQPSQSFVIGDLETLKVIADPLRSQILEAFILQPLTVKQVAERLGLAASKLYYHVNLLEKHGLIKVVDTRIVSGIIEKQYRATASRLEVDHSLLAFTTDAGKENINTVLLSTLDTTRDDILRSLQARYFELETGNVEKRPRRVVVARQLSRIPDERAEEFGRRLDDLLKEFDTADTDAPDLQTYALTIAFYPSFYFREPGQQDSDKE